MRTACNYTIRHVHLRRDDTAAAAERFVCSALIALNQFVPGGRSRWAPHGRGEDGRAAWRHAQSGAEKARLLARFHPAMGRGRAEKLSGEVLTNQLTATSRSLQQPRKKNQNKKTMHKIRLIELKLHAWMWVLRILKMEDGRYIYIFRFNLKYIVCYIYNFKNVI